MAEEARYVGQHSGGTELPSHEDLHLGNSLQPTNIRADVHGKSRRGEEDRSTEMDVVGSKRGRDSSSGEVKGFWDPMDPAPVLEVCQEEESPGLPFGQIGHTYCQKRSGTKHCMRAIQDEEDLAEGSDSENGDDDVENDRKKLVEAFKSLLSNLRPASKKIRKIAELTIEFSKKLSVQCIVSLVLGTAKERMSMEARLSYIYLLTECLLIESSMCRKENDGKRARMATTFRSVIGNIILGELIPMMMTDHMRHKISTLSKFWERERLMDDSVLSSIRVELASCEDDYIISLQPETEARKSRRASRMATFLDNVLVQKNEKIHHQIHKKFPTGESRDLNIFGYEENIDGKLDADMVIAGQVVLSGEQEGQKPTQTVTLRHLGLSPEEQRAVECTFFNDSYGTLDSIIPPDISNPQNSRQENTDEANNHGASLEEPRNHSISSVETTGRHIMGGNGKSNKFGNGNDSDLPERATVQGTTVPVKDQMLSKEQFAGASISHYVANTSAPIGWNTNATNEQNNVCIPIRTSAQDNCAQPAVPVVLSAVIPGRHEQQHTNEVVYYAARPVQYIRQLNQPQHTIYNQDLIQKGPMYVCVEGCGPTRQTSMEPQFACYSPSISDRVTPS